MKYLADTSAVARFLLHGADAWGWGDALGSGLVGMCEVTEIEALRSAHHKQMQQYLGGIHAWAPIPHLLVAAVAELSGLTLLHCDHDFEAIARHTGQPTMMLADSPRQ
ncbi:PIN domain-containing protein [Streptomyces flavidovirens]|uniref:VapC toxin family PIN domain ribonuclease n=1 Tax=Streptomyces flavidovirens TaxID=67298 RepID=A0ABW6RGQ2_9ACTN